MMNAAVPKYEKLFEALALAQSEMMAVAYSREVSVAIKDKVTRAVVGNYKFSYATLATILQTIREPMTKNGLWYTQFIDKGVMVTRIFHKSGQWLDTGMIPMPDIKGSPQDIGSIVSYFKRYSLSEALGLGSEEDNDGEDSQGDHGAREVSFRAKGVAQQRDSGPAPDADVGVPEPQGGWGDWTRKLVEEIDKAGDQVILDEIKMDEARMINAVRRVDKAMYDEIGRAFTRRRSVLNPNEAI